MSFLLPLPLFQKKYTRCKWLAYVGFFPRRKTIFYAWGNRLPSGGQGGQGCSPGHRSAATKENETQAMASRASIRDAFQTNPRTRTVCQRRFQSASACASIRSEEAMVPYHSTQAGKERYHGEFSTMTC